MRHDFGLAVFAALLAVALSANTVTASASPRAPTTPVIVIPGILGSKLCTNAEPAQTIWPGDTATGFPNLAALRLPTTANAGPALRSCGLLEKFQTFFQIWDVSLYLPLIEFMKTQLHYPDKQLTVFDYDWRSSNFDNAQRLAQLIEQIKTKSGATQVDIVAHSMGGIVARIYLQKYGGAVNVRHAVFLGVPHRQTIQPLKSGVFGWRSTSATAGSCSPAENSSTLGSLVSGVSNFFGGLFGDAATQDAGSEPQIRESVFSWPSTYELLPLEDCCSLSGGNRAAPKISLATPEAWERLPWFPRVFFGANGHLTSQFSQFLAHNLARSGELGAMLRQALPIGPQYTFIASQDHYTNGRALFDVRSKIVGFKATCGDGAVTMLSASNGDIVNARLVKAPHETIFDDPQAHTYIAMGLGLIDQLDVATAGPPIALSYYRSCTGEIIADEKSERNIRNDAVYVLPDLDGTSVCVRNISIGAMPAFARSGRALKLRVRIGGYHSLWRREISPTVALIDATGNAIAKLRPSSGALSMRDGVPSVDFDYNFVPSQPQIVRAEVSAQSIAEGSGPARFSTTIEIVADCTGSPNQCD